MVRFKKSLGRIENNIEEGRKFDFRSVFGAFFISMGFGLIGFVFAGFNFKGNMNDLICGVCYGVLMLVAGSVILALSYIFYHRYKE